jgi:hypothetical protein
MEEEQEQEQEPEEQPASELPASSRENRLALIRAIQEARDSHVIAYFAGDRQGAAGQIGEDAVRPMYDHVRALGFKGVPRIDLFLYSRGGSIEAPWRIISMLREYCQELNVLIPYRAYSAATLIALGADHIVMGKKGELGPIDPLLTKFERGERTVTQEEMSVEDVMSFVSFLKERVGIEDGAALASSMNILAEKLNPWLLGAIYRAHSHIRLIARKLLTCQQNPPDEQHLDSIVDSLAERLYFHGHDIARSEAKEMGLPIVEPDEELENKIWQLFEAYEALMRLRFPIDPRTVIPPGQDEYFERVILACIESEAQLSVFRGDLRLRYVRQMSANLNLNLNLNVQLPPGLRLERLPEAARVAIQQMFQQLEAQIATLVQIQVQRQAPIQGTEGGLFNAFWQEATNEGI